MTFSSLWSSPSCGASCIISEYVCTCASRKSLLLKHAAQSFAESRGGRRSAAHDKGASDDERDASRTEESDGAANDEDGPGDSTAGSADDGHVPDAELAKARQRLAEKGRGQRAGRRSESKRGGASKKPAKPGKKPRKWGDSKLSTEEMKELDRSAAPAHSGGAAAAAAEEFGSALDMVRALRCVMPVRVCPPAGLIVRRAGGIAG